MQITETLADGLKRAVQVVVPATELEAKLQTRLKEIQKTANIKGFRVGRVPIAHLKKLYASSIMGETINEAINEASQTLSAEGKPRIASAPQLQLNEDKAFLEKLFAGEEDLVFSLTYEVLPAFDLPAVQDLSVERQLVEISEDEVQEQVLKALESTRDFSEKTGEAASGDRVKIDYLGKLDGEPFAGGQAENAFLVLGSNSFIPGFEEQLLGSKAGDEKVIKVTFPEDYHAAHLAGKEVAFEIKVHEVAEAAPVEATDEAAEKLGMKSLADLTAAVRQQIEGYYGNFTRQRLKKEIFDKLDELCKFELPESLVETEFNNIWNRVLEELKHNNGSFTSEEDEAQQKQEYRTLAERRVRLGLLLSEYGREAKIEVSEQELQQALFDQLRQHPGQEEQIYKAYQSNPQLIDMLRAPIFEDKTIDYLLSKLQVTDRVVSKEALVSLEDDESDAKDASAQKKAKKTKAKS